MTVRAIATFSGRQIRLFALVVAAVSFASPAFAERVQLSGTHSKDEIKKACDGLDNGINVEGPGGSGYGCYNENNGVLVACNDNGTCTGYIPAKRKMTKDSKIIDFLSLGPAPREGSGVKGKRQPFDPFAIVKSKEK